MIAGAGVGAGAGDEGSGAEERNCEGELASAKATVPPAGVWYLGSEVVRGPGNRKRASRSLVSAEGSFSCVLLGLMPSTSGMMVMSGASAMPDKAA